MARPKRKNTKLKPAWEHKETPEAKGVVLRELSKGMTVKEACDAAGVGRTTVFEWKARDEEFARLWDQALEDGVDLLEAEARRRGRDGIDRGIYHAGERVDTERHYSDSLLTMMLKGRRAAVYNTDRVEHSGKDGGPIIQSLTVEFVSAKEKK